MFDELKKYQRTGHFIFSSSDDLSQVCNAPSNSSGVYLIYALENGKIELIYIGRSGEIKRDGTLFIRKAGFGGLKDRLINGKQFGERRRKSWKGQMLEEKIEALDIYWYVTHCDDFIDCPKRIENRLLNHHLDIFGRLPRWNLEI
jgi:hypothetical protein